MAKRIGMLSAQQAATDSPRLFLKHSIVRGMIRRLEACWIVKGELAQKLRMKAPNLVSKPIYSDGRIHHVYWYVRPSGGPQGVWMMQAQVYRYA